MKKFTLNKRLLLLTVEPQSGSRTNKVTASATVWANVSDVGVTTKLTALSAGQTVELAVVMYRREFNGYTHAEYKGHRYKIVETGAAESDLLIKLLLERD